MKYIFANSNLRGSKFSQLTNNFNRNYSHLSQNTRIVGVDVARAFAIFLMVIIHFFEMNPSIYNNPAVYYQAYFLFGRARFIFFLIAGVGLFYLSRESRMNQNKISLNYTKKRIMTRGIVIGVIGIVIWVFVGLAFNLFIQVLMDYGLFFFLFSFAFNVRKKLLAIFLGILILLFIITARDLIILSQIIPFNQDPTYFNQLFFISEINTTLEAFSIILLGFLVANLLISRKYLKHFILLGMILVVIPILLDKFFSTFLISVNLYKFSNPNSFGIGKPFLDYISRLGSSLILIPLINVISSASKKNILTNAIALSGQHAFTLYVLQILLIPIISSYIIIDNVFLAVIFGSLTIIFLILFSNLNHVTKYTKPFELIVRHFSDSYKNIKLAFKPADPSLPPFNISEFNKGANFCINCGSKLNYFDPKYVLSVNRDSFGLNIHKEALKGALSQSHFWQHINNLRYLFDTNPNLNEISASEVYCPKDFTTGLRLVQEKAT